MLALIVAVVNSVAGLAIAFVLVRDDFRGKAFVSAVIDLPFALPTIVAGLTLLALYGANSPFHVDLAGTRLGIGAALLFVTLPFCVRSVQPVLAELDAEIEEAAASLGATRRQVLRRILLPSLLPSVLAGAGLAFARAIGEFGSVVLISGNLPFKTEVASSWIFSLSQSDDLPAGERGLHRPGPDRPHRARSPSAGPAGASTSRRRCDVKGSRWRLPLRFGVLGYLALLVVLPVGTVFYRAFQHGLGAAWDALTAPDALHALWLTLLVARDRRAVEHGLRRRRLDHPGPPPLPRRLAARRAGRHPPGALPRRHRPGADPRLRAHRLVRQLAGRPGHHRDLLGARHRHGLGRRLPPLRRARGAAGPPGDRAPSRSRRPARSGARPFTVFRRITLPNIRRGLAYGVTLTTARVLGEFGAVAIVSGAIAGKTETLTLFIYDSIDNLDPQSAYIGAVALCLAALIVLMVLTLTDRKRDEWHGKAAA